MTEAILVRCVTVFGLAAAVVCSSAAAQVNANTPGWMAFPMTPLDDLSGADVDLSRLNPPGCPARIVVADGHFATEAGERRGRVPVSHQDDGWRLELGSQNPSLWYILER